MAVLGLAAIAVAAGVQLYRRHVHEEAERKATKPALEFAAVDIVRLQRRKLAVETELPGTVQAISQATVRAKVAAEVKRVLVREGHRVAAGQTLAEFDTAQLRAQLAERSAALESAKAELATSELTRKANAQLLKQKFISQNAFDTSEGAYQTKLAAVAVAKAQLEVQAQAPLTDIAKIEAGMPATVEIEGLAERSFQGKVERINPSAEPGTRSIHVYVSLRNEGSLLKSGMFARVRLTLEAEREAAALPVSAVRGEGVQTYVWLISGHRLERRPVSTGTRDERASLIEILSGVQPTEDVIATKFDNLQHGFPARVKGEGGARTVEQGKPNPG